MNTADLRAWIGRSCVTTDRLDPAPSSRLAAALGRVDDVRVGGVALVEEQDAVYRDAPLAGGPNPARTGIGARRPSWTRTLEPDEVLLFRDSALTFNAHRIHYDWRYATSVAGYPRLLVHGPRLATWLLDHLRGRLWTGTGIVRPRTP